MIPLRDDNPTKNIPFITIFLIGLNCLVFGFQLSFLNRPGHELQQLVQAWGFIPARLTTEFSLRSFTTLITCMFLHGSVVHLGSNMLFLWVFGDNIEDELGHANFFLFYVLAGLAGSFSQFFVNPGSTVPMIGASGAISGVIAAYLLLFPSARVLTAVILIIFVRLIYLPAWVILGLWILIQVLVGTASLGLQGAGSNVAWFAHIGGFGAGIVLSFTIFVRKIYRR